MRGGAGAREQDEHDEQDGQDGQDEQDEQDEQDGQDEHDGQDGHDGRWLRLRGAAVNLRGQGVFGTLAPSWCAAPGASAERRFFKWTDLKPE